MAQNNPVAPPGGLRHRGKTYKAGQQLPKHYGRVTPDGGVSLDPARGVPGAPPNFGRDVLPQILTFSGRFSTVNQVYRNPDTAYAQGPEQARIMRNDPAIMECLEARQRGTALLNWHLEPEDKKDDRQRQLADDLTDILKATPDFTEYRRNLLEAIWYGRYAVQSAYGDAIIKGKKRTVIRKWLPINGDKLVFRYDDGTGKYSGDEIGVKVGLSYGRHDAIAGDRKIEMTDQGPAYFLEPWERTRIALHKHIIEDGVYEDALSAGRIHGVGVRDRIYWCWFQKQETMAHLMEVIERTGSGFTIYYYPAHNPQAETEVKEIARNQHKQNVLVFPRSPGDPAFDAYGIDRIEPSTAGIDALKAVVHEFFGWQIKRYIIGQVLSSEAEGGGIGGSGIADLHQETMNAIVKYDAVKLEETMTNDTVKPIKDFNFPEFRDVRVRFVIDTESANAEKKLAAYRSGWDMGLRLKASDVYDSIGASMPTADDEVLQNPAMAAGGGMPGQEQPGAPGGEMNVADLFGPAMDEGGEEPDEGRPPEDDGPDEPKGPAMYAKWDESKHPRGQAENAGEFRKATEHEDEWGKFQKYGDAIDPGGNWKRLENIPDDAYVVLHHATSRKNAEAILKNGWNTKAAKEQSPYTDTPEDYVYLGGKGGLGTYVGQGGKGDAVILSFRVRKGDLQPDKGTDWKSHLKQFKSDVIRFHGKDAVKNPTVAHTFAAINQVRAHHSDVEPIGFLDPEGNTVSHAGGWKFVPKQYAAGIGADARWKTKHTVGETKSIQGHTYVLNEHHRWELQNRDDVDAHNAETIDASGTPGEEAGDGEDAPHKWMTLPDKPPEDGADDHEQRHGHVAKALGQVDPQASGLIKAFHEHPDYKSGGEVASQKLDANHAAKLHSWLGQSAAKGDGPPIIMPDGKRLKSSHIGGGIAVDFGDGRTGFASEAGSFVVHKDGRANYTTKTGIVAGGMSGKPLLGKQAVQMPGGPPVPAPSESQTWPPPPVQTAQNRKPGAPNLDDAVPAVQATGPAVAPGYQSPAQGTPNAAAPPQANAAPQAGPAAGPIAPATQAPAAPVVPNGNQAAPAGQPDAQIAPAGLPGSGNAPERENPHRPNADRAHAEWQDSIKGMENAMANGADAKDLAAWGRFVRSKRSVFREYDQAANHHDKSQKKAKGPGQAPAAAPPSDGLSDADRKQLAALGLDPSQVTEQKPTATVDPSKPKFGSPEAKAMARMGIDPNQPKQTGQQARDEFAAKMDAKRATPLLPDEDAHGHHTAAHEALASQAASEPDEAKAASLAAQAVTHGHLAEHHSSAVHGDGVKSAIADAHAALHKAGIAHEPVGHGIPPSNKPDESTVADETPAAPTKPERPQYTGADEWKNHVKRHMERAGLEPNENNLAAVHEALDKGNLKNPEQLKRVLATAKRLHVTGAGLKAHGKRTRQLQRELAKSGGSPAIQSALDAHEATDHQHSALKTALHRQGNRKEVEQASPEVMANEGAKHWSEAGGSPMSADEYKELAKQAWEQGGDEEYAAGVKAIRDHTGIKSAKAAQNGDEQELSDEIYMVFQEHPALGIDPKSSPQEMEDAAWELLKGDDKGVPPLHSQRYWDRADQFIGEMMKASQSGPGAMLDDEAKAVPFSATWRDGYRRILYAKKLKSSPGQGGMFDESKHPRGMPENQGEFRPAATAAAELFNLENKAPRPAGEKFENLGGKQEKMFHGMGDLPGQKSMFAGLDLTSKEPLEGEAKGYKEGEKYHVAIPEITHLPPDMLKRMNSLEVDEVSPDDADSMNFDEPVEVSLFADGEMRLSDGHHRRAAAKQKGMASIPVKVQAINARGEKINELISLSRKLAKDDAPADKSPDDAPYAAYVATMQQSGIEPLAKEDWVKRRDEILAKRNKTANKTEEKPAEVVSPKDVADEAAEIGPKKDEPAGEKDPKPAEVKKYQKAPEPAPVTLESVSALIAAAIASQPAPQPLEDIASVVAAAFAANQPKPMVKKMEIVRDENGLIVETRVTEVDADVA